MSINRRGGETRNLVLGSLFFLGYYEIIAGLRVPFNFTVNRVTYVYLFQAPLLGFFEFDLAAYLILAAALFYKRGFSFENKRVILLIFLNLMMALGFMLGLTWLIHITLGLACLFTVISQINIRKDAKRLLSGFLFSLLLLETVSLISLASYYALGEWNKMFFRIILRERLFWSPLEWVSVLALIISMWNALAYIITGRWIAKIPNPLPQEREGRDDKGIGMLILALLLIVLLVLLPHLPTVNPCFKPVSVDVIVYGSFLEETENAGLTRALTNGGMGRPLYLIAIYWLWVSLGKNTILLMDLLHPLVALTGLALTSFYVAQKIGYGEAAGWAALLIPLGYAATGFLSGGFQANSVALIPALLTLTISLKSLRDWLTLIILLTVTGLIHPWTHLMYSAAIVAKNLRDRRRLILSITAFILSYCLVYAVDSTLTAGEYRAESPLMPLAQYAGFHIPRNWFDAIRLWIWNALSNPIYLSTAILPLDPTLASFMGVTALPTIILNAEMTCRIILNLPLQIQASKFLGRIKDKKMKILVALALLARVLGNLSGLAPLTADI
ncbi:MAG: hypothetical protein QW702_09125 [Candidatus Bathyarchaeia archaeon]